MQLYGWVLTFFCIIFLNPRPFKHSFSTSNFTSRLLNCFVLEHSNWKTKQLRSVLVKLLHSTEWMLKWSRLYSKLSSKNVKMQGREYRNDSSKRNSPHWTVVDDGERVIVGRSKNTTTMMLVFMTSRLDEWRISH